MRLDKHTRHHDNGCERGGAEQTCLAWSFLSLADCCEAAGSAASADGASPRRSAALSSPDVVIFCPTWSR